MERAKNPPPEAGDVWTWTAICADTKLVPSWRVGDRTAATALGFMDDLRRRLRHRVQLTSDGHKPYLEAVWEAFGGDVDYAMLIKVYGGNDSNDKAAHRRYSPGINGSERIVVQGSPDLDLISTSYAERSNLTLRTSMRRFTRLTNVFSKKLENHALMVSLFLMHYNWRRPHQALGKVMRRHNGFWHTYSSSRRNFLLDYSWYVMLEESKWKPRATLFIELDESMEAA